MLSACETSALLDISEALPTKSVSDKSARMRPLTRIGFAGRLFLRQSVVW
ncbi:hypothetical protein BH20CHL3_BH20CHL3_11150 [soil metagenome]